MDWKAEIAKHPYWYHKITLPDGTVTPGWAPLDPAQYGIPDDLTGKRVLDIGAWDGYWTWEALKRGAREVVAIDDFSDTTGNPLAGRQNEWATFDLCREAFGYTEMLSRESWRNSEQTVSRLNLSVYDIADLGQFDVVFFFGTLYHLKHPLLALESIAKVCTGEIYVESAICDDYSPYRGGLGHGYPNNDMVLEFYPGKQYGGNESNWFVPTAQCLGAMLQSVGFNEIKVWGLTDEPQRLPDCRGFAYGSKQNQTIEIPAPVTRSKPFKVGAVMSVPRLCFHDTMFCALEALLPLKIQMFKVQGAFWGQCLERGIQTQIDNGCDAILTIDYDTLFKQSDIEDLIRLMLEHPEADAIVPIQASRCGTKPLFTIKSPSGQVLSAIERGSLAGDLTKIATGHFGLTLLRTSSLMKLPHPWFLSRPDIDGQWGPQRVDEDIAFWKLMERQGQSAYLANRVVVGHMALMSMWPDTNLQTFYQNPDDYFKQGKPAGTWS